MTTTPRYEALEALAQERLPPFTFTEIRQAVGGPTVVMPPVWPTQQQVLDRLEAALRGDAWAACDVLRWYRVLGSPEDEAQQDVVAQLSLGFQCLGTACSPGPG